MTFVKRGLALLLAAGVAASAWTIWTRSRVPQGGPQSELVVRLEAVYESSRLHGIPVGDLLDAFRQAGVTTVAVEAKSLMRLEYAGQASVVYDPSTGLYSVLARGGATAGAAGLTDQEFAAWLARDLARWAPRQAVEPGTLGPGSLSVAVPAFYPLPRKDKIPQPVEVFRQPTDPLAPAQPERDLFLGLSPADIALVKAHGLLVAAFIPNAPEMTAEKALQLLDALGDGKGFSAVEFDGATALGWPDPAALTAVGERLKAIGVPFVVLDQPQPGLGTVAKAAGWMGIRQQPVWTRSEPDRFPEVARERRQNFLYLQSAFFDGTSADWLRQVTNGLAAIVRSMEANGLVMGKTVPFQAYAPPLWALALMVSGVMAAAILGFILFMERPGGRLFAGRAGAVLAVLLGLAWVAPVAAVLVSGNQPAGLTLQVQYGASFLASVILPSLAVALALRLGFGARGGRSSGEIPAGASLWARALRAVGVTIVVAALPTLGGLFEAAIGSNTAFMLRLDIFRGTKLSLLVTPVAAAFLFLGQVGLYPAGDRAGEGATEPSVLGRGLGQLARLLHEYINVGYVVLAGVAGVAGLILLLRSGNFPTLPIPSLELKLRAFLQQALLVRPRTKEFLIGYPALVLLVWWGARWREQAWSRWAAWILAVAAGVGLASVTNTFAHQHIPVSVSLLRTFNALVLGLGIGLVLALASEAGVSCARRRSHASGPSRGGGKLPT